MMKMTPWLSVLGALSLSLFACKTASNRSAVKSEALSSPAAPAPPNGSTFVCTQSGVVGIAFRDQTNPASGMWMSDSDQPAWRTATVVPGGISADKTRFQIEVTTGPDSHEGGFVSLDKTAEGYSARLYAVSDGADDPAVVAAAFIARRDTNLDKLADAPCVTTGSAPAANDPATLQLKLSSLAGSHIIEMRTVPTTVTLQLPKTGQNPAYASGSTTGGITCSKVSVQDGSAVFDIKARSNARAVSGTCERTLGASQLNLTVPDEGAFFGDVLTNKKPIFYYLQSSSMVINGLRQSDVRLLNGDCTTSEAGTGRALTVTFGTSPICEFTFNGSSTPNLTVLKQAAK